MLEPLTDVQLSPEWDYMPHIVIPNNYVNLVMPSQTLVLE